MELDIYNWILEKKDFTLEDFTEKFKSLKEEGTSKEILKYLESEKLILESISDSYDVLEYSRIFKNKIINEVLPELKKMLKGLDNKQSLDIQSMSWDDVREIDKFVIFEGSERIYEVHLKNKKVRLEGKEIMDYNIFRLRFFEEFGVLLETYKGIGADWANLVSYWNEKYGEVSKDKIEVISDIQEAEDLVIDYINNSTVSDNHLVREGIVCIKEDAIFVSTKIIKKLLRRSNLSVSLRKLCYVMQKYMISGSIPLKIENKSERFWKFKKDKFTTDESNKLELQKEEDA